MSNCECDAHYLQNCSWWCGLSESEQQEQYEVQSPEKFTASKLKQLETQIMELKEMIKSLGGKHE